MSTSVQATASAKRVRVDSHVDKENYDARQATKKARLEVSTRAADPYTTLPPPTTSFIQLRFQLARFKGVYRVARIPLNYTFANLYKLILLMFGWSGDHLHRASVYSHIEMYSGNYKAGHIKKYGKPAAVPETDDEGMQRYYELTRRTDIAEYEVVMKGRSTRLRGRGPFDDYLDDAEVRIEDQNLCLSQVWNQKLRRNGSQGACSNKQMGVIYEYDLGDSWTIHITMEDFFSVEPASNLPVMVMGKNKGAPPIEDVCGEVYGELEGSKKSISTMLFDRDVFERYLKGEVTSYAGKKSLEVREVAQGSACAAPPQVNSGDDEDMDDSDSDDSNSDNDDEDSNRGNIENMPTAQPQSASPLALVPSNSRAVSQPIPEEYDDLHDAEGENYDSEEEIDEETALMVALLVTQQMHAAAMLMLML